MNQHFFFFFGGGLMTLNNINKNKHVTKLLVYNFKSNFCTIDQYYANIELKDW